MDRNERRPSALTALIEHIVRSFRERRSATSETIARFEINVERTTLWHILSRCSAIKAGRGVPTEVERLDLTPTAMAEQVDAASAQTSTTWVVSLLIWMKWAIRSGAG
jgi:hypothetical protein